MGRNLVADVNENLRSAGVRVATHSPDGETRHFGGITAACTGIPASYFNRIFVFDTPTDDQLAAAVSWMTDRDVPFLVTVAGPAIEGVAELTDYLGLRRNDELNWTAEATQPGMALPSLDAIPATESTVSIAEVTDSDGFDDFVTSFRTIFEAPRDHVTQLYRPLLSVEESRLFFGRVEGVPVACGRLEQSGDAAGVHNIGVVEEFRRQGIGEALSWAVLRAGREAGCDIGVLQSSEMGHHLYERMGFETVIDYHHYESEN